MCIISKNLIERMEFQKYISKFLSKRKKISEQDLEFCSKLAKIIGYEINNIAIYREAFSLKSADNKNSTNYERLEFLGDSVLGAIISSHLFSIYPESNEGFLTQMKSKIVNRKNLNKLGDELKLIELLQNHKNNLGENISGNLFEALIGAIYLDYDYEICKKIVLEKMFTPEQINRLENKIVSYKSLLLEWSQKKKVNIKYDTAQEAQVNKMPAFRSCVWMDNQKISNATDSSKKKAEEKAAQRAFYFLNKKESIVENTKINS